MSNAGSKCVVHRGVAERALYTHGLQRTVGIEKSSHADDGIQFQQRQRHSRIIEVNFPSLDLLARAAGSAS